MIMTRTAFLAALEQLLASLPESERKDALSYYEDYLDAAGPENEARAIAELGSPEEVARKILDEQSPADSSAAPVSPARKPRSRWRMVLGGGLAVLVLAAAYVAYVFLAYHRIPDNQVLTVEGSAANTLRPGGTKDTFAGHKSLHYSPTFKIPEQEVFNIL